jgi:parallel beta-helix repeat protein
VSESGATVAGRVISDTGGTVEYWVQFGLTTAYGSEASHATVTTQQNVPQTVTVVITGLARSTLYHYRLCARDSQQGDGPGCGIDRTLTTQSWACGETVTTSIRLTGDVFCGESDVGLIVGADGIEINLAGHSLGTLSGIGGGFDAIRNPGHDFVTVRNGSLVGATHLIGASRNLVRDIEAFGGADVIRIEGGAFNEVRANDLTARGSGVGAENSNDLVVANNDTTGGLGPGIRVVGDRARIVRNRVPYQSASLPAGIELTGSDGRIVDNRVTGPWLGGGIVLRGGSNDVIAENQVSDAGNDEPPFDDQFNDGIFVGAFTAGTLLRDNLVERNTGDGIEVQASNAALGGNRALDNGDFGIDAAAGVTDLGGNVASGNGNPVQCRNVFCQ